MVSRNGYFLRRLKNVSRIFQNAVQLPGLLTCRGDGEIASIPTGYTSSTKSVKHPPVRGLSLTCLSSSSKVSLSPILRILWLGNVRLKYARSLDNHCGCAPSSNI